MPPSRVWASRARRARRRAASAQARAIARELGFPVLVRPSFVLGGRAMEIVYNEAQLAAYAESAPPILPDAPLLVDKYLRGLELEVDAVFDGDDILVPGVFEHVERAGVHSGDSISVYPVQSIDAAMERRIVDVTLAIARELGIRGLINIQFVVHDETLVHYRSQPARQPYRSDHSEGDGHQSRCRRDPHRAGREAARYGVRNRAAPARSLRRRESAGFLVFEDARRRNDIRTGDEVDRRSARNRRDLRRGAPQRVSGGRRSAAWRRRPHSRLDRRRREGRIDTGASSLRRAGAHARRDARHACDAREAGIATEPINKIADGSPHVLDLIASRAVDLVINDAKGAREISDDYKIRRAAVEASIACLTSLDTARALAEALTSKAGPPRSLQEYLAAPATIAP